MFLWPVDGLYGSLGVCMAAETQSQLRRVFLWLLRFAWVRVSLLLLNAVLWILLVVGCWSFVVGCWLLVVVCGNLDI